MLRGEGTGDGGSRSEPCIKNAYSVKCTHKQKTRRQASLPCLAMAQAWLGLAWFGLDGKWAHALHSWLHSTHFAKMLSCHRWGCKKNGIKFASKVALAAALHVLLSRHEQTNYKCTHTHAENMCVCVSVGLQTPQTWQSYNLPITPIIAHISLYLWLSSRDKGVRQERKVGWVENMLGKRCHMKIINFPAQLKIATSCTSLPALPSPWRVCAFLLNTFCFPFLQHFPFEFSLAVLAAVAKYTSVLIFISLSACFLSLLLLLLFFFGTALRR